MAYSQIVNVVNKVLTTLKDDERGEETRGDNGKEYSR